MDNKLLRPQMRSCYNYYQSIRRLVVNIQCYS